MPLPAPEEAVSALAKAFPVDPTSKTYEITSKNVDFLRMLEEFGRANDGACPPESALPRPSEIFARRNGQEPSSGELG